ncbi:aflatoxin efflux pump [Clathrospora elynae]|uniref:Aflatoxin efflux pump n=1 Tax=Clathrospora elynae TaxID=706981 RepID=A0A6A5SCR6_9PLEO|nr:aflatoxin efflux pump [Clathrospora elynae]
MSSASEAVQSAEERPAKLSSEKKAGDGDTLGTPIRYPNAFRTTAITTGVACALFATIVATAIPKITDEFGGIDLVGWYESSFFILLACFQPFWGKTYQYFPLKYTFMLAVFIFEVGSLVAGIAPSSSALIIGRAITGIGGAGIATGGYAILSVVVRPELRPVFTGAVTTVYSLANVMGPIIGGLFAEHITWRWCFYISLPIGGTSAIIIFLLFSTPSAHREKEKVPLIEKLSQLDPIGILLALGSLLCFARAFQVGGITMAWNSSEVIGLLVGFGVCLILFLVSQRLLDDRAMMVARLLRTRSVVVGMAYGFFLESAFYTLLYALPIYFQAVGDVSPAQAGLRNLPLLIACGIGSMSAGILASKYRHFIPLMVWAAGGGCIGTGLIYTLGAKSSSSYYIGYQVLAGLAYGTGLPLAIIVGQGYATLEDIPAATAMLLFTFCYGSSLALVAAQSILGNVVISQLRVTAPSIDPASVIRVGASEVASQFPADLVPLIVEAYLSGLRKGYLMLIALAGAATITAFFYRWEKLRIVDK